MENTWPSSLWRATAPDVTDNPELVGDTEADVTVVGAGFTGLRAALYLAEAGIRVAVLDAAEVGWGASGRTGGQVNPMLPFNSPRRLRKLLGDAFFERITAASLGSADELFGMVETYQIECQARQKGWLRVHHSKRAHEKALADVKDWNDHGADMTVVESADVFRLSGSRAYRSGVIAPKGGAVHPLMLAQGMARAFRDRGGSIHGKTPVKSIDRDGDRWVCKTEKGTVRSEWVVVATNAYSDSLLPGLSESIIPLTPIQIATDPLPPELADEILPQGHTISDSRRIIMYARKEPDNRIVYGGLGRQRSDGTLDGFDWLRRDAARVFPQLQAIPWTHEWGGRIALTNDHLPHLHEPCKGILAGLGYNGRGVAMSMVVGRTMAQRILGAPDNDLAFPINGIRKFPFRAGKLLGLESAIGVMRLLDYLESR